MRWLAARFWTSMQSTNTLSRTVTPCPARRATSVAGTPASSHSDMAPALASRRPMVQGLAGGQSLDDAELEPVAVLDSELKRPHVPDRAAPEVLASSRHAGDL